MSNSTGWLSFFDSSSRSLLPPNNLRDSLTKLFLPQRGKARLLSSVALTVLMAVFFSQSSFAQELILNPGFESKLTGWVSNKAPIRTIAATNPVKTGVYSAHVNNASQDNEYFYQNLNASPFGNYTFSVWAMVHDASKWSSVGVNVYDANWIKIPSATVEIEVNSTAFQKYSKNFTVPSNARYMQVYGYTEWTVLKLDDFSLTDVCASLTVSGTNTNVTTNGGNNGAVNVTVSGGIAPYIYSWSNGATTQDLTALKAGIYWLTVTDANKCVKTYQAVITQPYGTCTGFRTQTQGGWGSKANGENPGTYRDANFAAAFPNGVTVGCGTKLLKLTTAKAVEDFLPSGSTSSVLPAGTLTNPAGSYSNVLAGQVVALTLNIGFDNYDPAFGSSTTNLKNLLIATGTFAGKSVQFLLDEANKALGGCSTTYSLSDINNAVTSVNENYVNGTNTGDLFCTPPPTDLCTSFSVSGVNTNVTTNGGTNGAVNVTLAGGKSPFVYSWSNGATTEDLTGLKAGIYWLTVTDANKCVKTYQAVITQPNGACVGFRTQTQGGWGSKANGENPGAYRDANFAAAFPSGVTVGCGTKLLKLTTAKAVEDFLPSGSTPAVLPAGTLTNPAGTYSNVLAGQVVALTLNIGFDNYDATFGSSATNLKNLIITTGTFAGKSVQFLLDEANKALGGCSTTYSLSDINSAVTSVNENYVNGTSTGDFLGCCNNVTSGGTIGSNQSGCGSFDPAAFTNVTSPSGGGTTALEFVWLRSTTSSVLTTATQSQWTTINGATGLTYDSGPITQTTYFIRCSRRAGCTDYVGESNVLAVTVSPSCTGKDLICLSRKSPIQNSSFCGDATKSYGMWFSDLKGNVASPSQYFTVKSGELTEFCDGTAILTYTACVTGGGANDCISTTVNYSGRTSTAPAGSPVANTHCGTYNPNTGDWYYYPTSSGGFTGTGIYAGLTGTYTQNMGAFQLGTGGSLNDNSKFGASSWFKIGITSGGTNNWSTVSKDGDFNINLGTSTNIASVTATANPASICKGENVVLTATIDAASKSANCSPTYSWVGSNGFTSNQATVTNTNVQGATTYTVTVSFTAINGSKCSVTATTGVALNAVCCDNVTNGGQIAANQRNCGAFDPAPFTNVQLPTGGTGTLEYLWLKSTTATTFTAENAAEWIPMIGTNSPTLDVNNISVTTAYQRCSRRAGCTDYDGETNVIIVIIDKVPNAPTTTPAAICGTGTVTLGATCTTGVAQWYAALTGGTALATGASFTTPSISATTTYYVGCKSPEGCESTPRTTVVATINSNATAPTVTPVTICGTGTATLGATCTTGVAQWYVAATGGSSIATGASFTTPSITTNTTYYVSCKSGAGCESERVPVKATVIGKITDGGKIQYDENICPGKTPSQITSATPASGGDASLAIEYIWLQTTSLTNGVCPQNIVGQTLYTQIPGATSTDYQPGVITQTTCYIRCARRAGCTDYIGGESNIVKKTLLATCQGKDPICLSRKTPVENSSFCGDATKSYGMWFSDLKGNVASPNQLFSVKSGELTEFCDGTAVLTYTACVTGGGSGDCITATVNYSGRTGTPPVGSPVSNTHCTNYNPNVADWYYYPVSNGTFSGAGIYAGMAGTYTQNMGAFQVGTGGSLNDIAKFGASSWFKINITNGGTNNWTTASKDGDININLGTSTTIASVTATANPKAICSGEKVDLTATLDVNSKSANCSPSYSWVGSNGFTSTQATATNTNVTTSTTYTVTVTFTAVNGSKCSVTATTGVTVNPTPNPPTVTPAAICGTGTLGATCSTGTAQWYSSATGGASIATGASFTTPSISATTTYYVSCKTDATCESARTPVTATVNPIPATPTVKPATICGTGTAILGATCTTGTAQWYAVATGGASIATGASFTTPSISITTTYYVSCKTDATCESGRMPVTAMVNAVPNAPTVTPATTCGTGSVTLGATCTTGVAQWYSSATGGTALATGASFTTPSLSATTTYYVSCKSTEGCESAKTEVKAIVIVKITDGGTIKADEIICVGGTPSKITSVTSPTGGDASLAIEYVWLKTTSLTATGTCPLNVVGQNLYAEIPNTNTPDYQPGAITVATCYIRCARRAGCLDYIGGESNTVKKSVDAFPTAPTVTPSAICGTGTVTLGATCLTGATAMWYAASTGGASIATGASFTTPSISATTTYYVSCKTNAAGCESNRMPVTATINAIPATPTVKPAVICGSGTVTLGATCATGTAMWYTGATGGASVSTGASFTTPSISSTTTYYVSCKNTESCESSRTPVEATVNPIPNAPTTKGDAICGTGTVTLGATCATGTAMWYVAATGGASVSTGASFTTPSISATTTYHVSCKTTEGCESGRTPVTAMINPIPNPPTVTPAAICGTGTVTLGATCATGTAMWYVGSTGGASVSTGASFTTPSITATTTYYVNCKTAEGCKSERTPVTATINPIPNAPTTKGNAICGTGTVTLGGTCATGTAMWYVGATGGASVSTGASFTTPSISSTTTYYVSCKTTEGCESNRTPVIATINPIPNAPTVKGDAICGSGTVTLGGTCTTGNAMWYTGATGGASVSTGASFTTPSISATTTYYVSCKTTEGCESNRTPVTATINPIPATPTVKPAAICGAGAVTLGGTCTTGVAQWYAAATGGASVSTGASFTTPSISVTTTYYVSCKTTEGCESGRTPVTATINPIPNAPTVTPAAICGTGTVTLGATCTTGNAMWYTGATGGASVSTGASFTTPSISSTTTYYVSCKTTEGCESNRTPVIATINSIPNAPTVKGDAICGTGTVTLGGTCTTGVTQWYVASTGGASVSTGASFTTPSISSTTTYYVSCKTTEGCESVRIPVTATVNPIPNAPTVKPAAICGAGAVTLGGTCVTGTATWYAASTGGASIATGASFTTPSISVTTTYYVSCKTTEGCESGRTPVTATINPIPNAPTVTPAAICGTGTVTLGATCATGTAMWYIGATGGASVSTGASFTTPSISSTTTYYVSCKTTESCESGRTPVTATINAIPNAPTVKGAETCGSGSVTLGATCTTGVAQWYAAATGGSSIATGASYTTPTLTTTTSYYVSCKSSEGCESGRTEVKAIVIGKITDGGSIKADETICVGGTPSKITSVTPASGGDVTRAIEYIWLQTTSLTNGACPANVVGQNLYTEIPGSITPDYQPGAITQTTCYIRCARRNGCTDYIGGESNTVKKTVEATPNAPTAKGDAICGTGTVTLGATCTTGIAMWYTAATGGASIATGASFTTPSISATTSYYVSCKTTAGGCESGRTEVKATINAIPASPSAIKNASICGIGTVELGAICTSGIPQWYAASTGGASIATGSAFTTPSLSVSTTYYVSCKSAEGCESGRTPVTATVNANTNAPTVTPAAICGTGTVTLGANCATGVAQWYVSATGGASVSTGASFTTPSISATTTYYVSCKSEAGCESMRTPVTATINPIPNAPIVKGNAICGAGTVILGATCATGSAMWYTGSTGGVSIATGASFTTPSLAATTTYYVSCKSDANCESGRTPVTATINANATAPTVKGDAICGTGTVTLGATCATGTANWYSSATGGTSVATGASYTTPSLSATTTYYVSCKTDAGCESARTPVTATVNANTTAPTVTPAAICGTGTVTLGATCATGTANWYSASTGGAAIATGASFTTPSLTTTTSYYVSCKSSAGCESARTEVKATINPIPASPSAIKNASICGTGTVELGAICTSGIPQWYAASTGGASIATGSAFITPSLSVSTTYYVSCKSAEGCESGRIPVTATVNANTTAPTVTPAAICGTGTVTLGATCATGTANWYTASTGGASIATGASFTTPNISATTTYYVSCKSDAGCESARTPVTATVNSAGTAPTVTPATTCGTGSVTLGATCSTGTAMWYSSATGGTAIATGASFTTPSLTTTTSYYVSCKSSAGCESPRTEVKAIVIDNIKDGGTIKADETICLGGTPAKITSVTLPSGGDASLAIEYIWLQTTSLTNGACPLNFVGQNLYSPIPNTNTFEYQPGAITQTTCYIRCSRRKGCSDYDGESNIVKKTVESAPNAPTVTPAAICGTGTVTLGATCMTGTANWYTAATGGASIAMGASFTTPSLSATTTYYVSCKSTAGGCESARTAVVVTINSAGTAPTVTPATTCGTGSVTLGATCATGTAMWYAASTGGVSIATGASFTTPSLTTTTSYYVSCKSSAGCESARTEVKATVIGKITDGGTIKADETICAGTTPSKIVNVTLPTGGDANLAIEYIWLQTTSLTNGACPANVVGQNLYTEIPGSITPDYQPGAITQTTCYVRCARRKGCTDYIGGESNYVKKTVTSPFTISATTNPNAVCNGTTVTVTTTTTATGTITYAWAGPNGFTANTKDVSIPNATILANGVYTISASNGGGCSAVATVHVKVVSCLKIGDLVFNDKNNNGKQDAGELGIAGVTVKLFDNANTQVGSSTTTDANGNYLFSNLPAGTYTVEITAPAGYKSSTGTNGSATGIYEPTTGSTNVNNEDNGTTVSGQIIRSKPVVLTTTDNTNVDFGLFRPAKLGDFVFRDSNGNGIQDAGEVGVAGVTVKLYDSANNVIATTTTDANGMYMFGNLTAGNYTVEFVKTTLPSGLGFSPQGATTGDKDSDANVTTGRTATITLTEGQTNNDIDAGLTGPCDKDVTPPVLSACPYDILLKTRGTAATVSWTAPTATDNCGTPVITSTNASGSQFPVGKTVVTYTATDAKGNKTTCSFTVTVIKIITCETDTQAPVFYDCPTDITLNTTGTGVVANWDHPSVGDNCGIPSVIFNYSPGQTFPVGVTTVIYTAKDAKGNTSYCMFKVTVIKKTTLSTGPVTESMSMNNSVDAASETITTPTSTSTPITGATSARVAVVEEVKVGDEVSVYPNPTNSDFSIELSAELMKANSSVEVSVFNMTGTTQFTQTAKGTERVSVKVPVQDMPNGTYFVNVALDNGRMIIKKLQIVK